MDPCGSEEKQTFLQNYEDVNQFVQETLKAVVMATKCSNEMPAEGDDFDYYSSFQGFQDVMNIEGKRLLHMVQSILKHQNVKVNLGSSGGATDIEDKLDMLMDANDQILERVGSWLDEASGIKKNDSSLVIATATPKQQATASWNKKSPGSSASPSFRLLTARNIPRPQLKFKDKVDNSRRPFRPIIREKPNALKSLEESLRLTEGTTPDMAEMSDFKYPHPYQYELDNLTYPASQLESSTPQEAQSLEETPFTYVDSVSQLESMLELLQKQEVIAVDLEHHNYRTFQGITCLMQISTRTQDFLVDTLELRSHLHCLNTVLTDPNIVKVFHGADMDIDWLQRDLGLYVVNMFDTGQAARVLGFPRFSLSHLLQHYCSVTPDKQFQLADWRMRPLPEELQKYAREDSHYLPYIYDKMKNELLEQGNEAKNLLLSVLQRSTQICGKVYKKPMYTEDGFRELYMKNKRVFNSQQLSALQHLYQWRDETARMEDESYGYVMPNHMLLQICDILPREKQGILACCNPIPPLVRQYITEIYRIILAAREKPLHKVETARTKHPTAHQHPRYHVDSLLNCPHDLSRSDVAMDTESISTLLDQTLSVKPKSMPSSDSEGRIDIQTTPILSVFNKSTGMSRQTDIRRRVAEIKASFTNPYTQFLPVDDKTKVQRPTMTISVSKSKEQETTKKPASVWMLKPVTAKRKERDETVPASPASKAPPSKRSRTDLHDQKNTHVRFTDSEDEVEVLEKTEDDKKALPQDLEVPLRFQMPSKKKKNRNKDIDILESVEKHLKNIRKLQEDADKPLGQNPGDEQPTVPITHKNKDKKKNKKVKSSDNVTEVSVEIGEGGGTGGAPEFTPYDYKEGAKQLLQGPAKKKGHFDPQSELRKSKGPKVSQNKTFSKKGKKSFTWKT